MTPEAPGQPHAREPLAAAAAATGASAIAPVSLPAEPEKTFRAGEFLQSQSSAPGAQFDTECDVQKSMNQVVAPEVDALTELEPMAAAVEMHRHPQIARCSPDSAGRLGLAASPFDQARPCRFAGFSFP